MKGGKKIRRIAVSGIMNFHEDDVDAILTENNVIPENVITVCMCDSNVYVYYIS